MIKPDDSDEIQKKKQFNQTICANKKPYFFMYNYDIERINYQKFIEEVNSKSMSLYGYTFEDMLKMNDLNEDAEKFIKYCAIKCPIDIIWLFGKKLLLFLLLFFLFFYIVKCNYAPKSYNYDCKS